LTALISQAKTICDTKSLNAEIRHLREAFRQNGYSGTDFSRAMHHENKTSTEKETDWSGNFTLPTHYIIQDQHTTEKIRHKDSPHAG
jgi:hypothetical protein